MTDPGVLLGLSGGVDSAAAALLLKRQGYRVEGYCFHVCPTQAERMPQVRALAEALEIPLHEEDASSLFAEAVISDFRAEYEAGRTPSPCVRCNPLVKFRLLAEAADRLGIEKIATGHYVNVFDGPDGLQLSRALCTSKDQSYMLYRLPEEILARCIFPLGMQPGKDAVRRLAAEAGLPCASQKASQEICFIPDGDYASYLLRSGSKTEPGAFLDRNGQEIGRHQGILHYTVGQRKGLGQTFGRPMFVTEINAAENSVTLGENADLLRGTIHAEQAFFFGKEGFPAELDGQPVEAKIRYGASPAPGTLYKTGKDSFFVRFDEAQRAPTPGQSLVVYWGEQLLGGGVISGAEA